MLHKAVAPMMHTTVALVLHCGKLTSVETVKD